jgi:pyrroline-5-carboxylate reductase
MSWIFGTTPPPDLQDIVRSPSGTTHQAWLVLESQFLGNAKTHALQLDAESVGSPAANGLG